MPLPWIPLGAPSSARRSRLLSIFVLPVIEVQGGQRGGEGGGRSNIRFLNVFCSVTGKEQGRTKTTNPVADAAAFKGFVFQMSPSKNKTGGKEKNPTARGDTSQPWILLNDTRRMLGCFGAFYRSCSHLSAVNEYPAFPACWVMSGLKYSTARPRQPLRGATNTEARARAPWGKWGNMSEVVWSRCPALVCAGGRILCQAQEIFLPFSGCLSFFCVPHPPAQLEARVEMSLMDFLLHHGRFSKRLTISVYLASAGVGLVARQESSAGNLSSG